MRSFELFYRGKLKVHSHELADLLKNSRIKVYRVTWIGDPKYNWLVTEENIGVKSYKNKTDAIQDGKTMARRDRPAVIVIEYKKDSKQGQSSVSDWKYYKKR